MEEVKIYRAQNIGVAYEGETTVLTVKPDNSPGVSILVPTASFRRFLAKASAALAPCTGPSKPDH